MAGHMNEHKVKNMYKMIFLLFGALCVCVESDHQLCLAYGCFDSGDTQVYMTLDEDSVNYVDFNQRLVFWQSRIPSSLHYGMAYFYADLFRTTCAKDIFRWKPDSSVQKTKEPPDVVIYFRDEVINDEENTLICFAYNFYPPVINIRWAKNDEEVRVETPFIKTVSNSDGTFHVFSYLTFVPQEGDIYSCRVEHEALDEPKTRILVVETEEKSRGPTVCCGLGLTLGILGVAAGTFFFVKGKQRHDAG